MSPGPSVVFAAAVLLVDAMAQSVPTGFAVETLVTDGLDHPTDFCFLPDGRCLIASRSGLISIHAGTSTTAVAIGTLPWIENPYWTPTGLPSLAVDPGFATNGHLYVLYASLLDTVLHVDRFTCSGALANPTSTNLQFQVASRHVLLGAIPDQSGGSNGGSLRFGPDGMLYVSLGDDSSGCSAQQLASQSGCILRLDVSSRPPGGNLVLPPYGALDPGDNPFSANADFSQLLIANGIHNPVRMEIDPLSGGLYVGDVGSINEEEVSEYVRPVTGPLPFANFGWPWREGNVASGGCGGTVPTGLVAPIATVPHSTGWLRVVCGPRYRNQQGVSDFGSAYEGNLFFLDMETGELRRLVHNGTWQLAAPVAGQPTSTGWGTGFQGVTSLRLGPDGALWFAQQQVLQSGALRRVRPPGSMPSVVAVSGNGQRGPSGEPFMQPLVVRLFDPLLNPLPGGVVNFTIAGGGALSTSNPVFTDGLGFAQTMVASTFGGSVVVTASTPGGAVVARFDLYGRRLSTTPAGNVLVVAIDNQTDAQPPYVPYVVMVSFPGSPTVPTIVGPLCIDPMYALAIVIEDGIGAFGNVSLSGLGATGMPGLFRQYPLPPGLFNGQLMRFQAVGLDPMTGWFRTNCSTRQF